MTGRYVLVSPCKDEAEHIARTLASVARQTVLPAQWVIVDDGSTDASPAIVARWRARLPWIKLVRRPDGARAVGGGVVRAFDAGRAAIEAPHDFICKLDVDLDLPPRYFEIMLARMAADPRLGTTSGKTHHRHPRTGAAVDDLHGDEQSAGPAKFYRSTCLEAIGGFVTDVGWDGYDCHRARWMGWRAGSRDEPEARILHLRPMGSSQESIHSGRVRHGRGQYLIGTHPLFFAASAAMRAVRQRPYLTGSACAVFGYLRAALSGAPRHGDAEMTRFIRRFQLRALVIGKRAAAERAFRERRAALDASHQPVEGQSRLPDQPAVDGVHR